MLQNLHIENIAVIKSANIDFTDGFSVLTGETGAGKSIIIDSINLILGAKPQRDLIRSGEEVARVSALFSELSPSRSRRSASLDSLRRGRYNHAVALGQYRRQVDGEGKRSRPADIAHARRGKAARRDTRSARQHDLARPGADISTTSTSSRRSRASLTTTVATLTAIPS